LFSTTLDGKANMEEQEGEQVLCVGVGASKTGKVAGKGGRRVNTVQKNVYTCM
jgi:predicted RNA-binding protein YlqC (UPF0109 family)